MQSDELEIDPSCRKLIEVIPMVCTDEDDPEEIVKFDGDDPFDSARYGLKSRLRPGRKPTVERVEEHVVEWAKAHKKKPEDLDPNLLAHAHRHFAALERRKMRPRRFRPRIFRPPRPIA